MPRPGAIGLVPVLGANGLGIRIGEFVVDGHDGAQHAFILLDDGTVLEAQPSGARFTHLSHYDEQDIPVAWIDRDMSDHARALIVGLARAHHGDTYSWWAYVWLAANRVGLRPGWLRRKLNDPHSAMCSQLCDRVYREARALCADVGDKAALLLFADGRDPGNVTPGDLFAIAQADRRARLST